LTNFLVGLLDFIEKLFATVHNNNDVFQIMTAKRIVFSPAVIGFEFGG
jgi:hypothetical protein